MKLVIFDCDGTIVDSQHAIVAAMNEAFQNHGLVAPDRAAVVGVVGLSLTEAVQRLIPEHDRSFVNVVADSYKRAFAELRSQPEHREPLFPGARETILRLAARPDMVLGIATGKSRRGVDVLFDREGLGGYFQTIQTADDHPSKPHPSMIERAIADAGAERHATVMVGDTVYDVEMARHAGVGALGVAWGYHPSEELARAGAHVVIDDYSELEHALAGLLGIGEAAS